MADLITRCPKCGTAFRISEALLKSAKGVVRCGSCLSVFNAREHMEAKQLSSRPIPATDERPAPASAATAKPTAPAQRPAVPRPEATTVTTAPRPQETPAPSNQRMQETERAASPDRDDYAALSENSPRPSTKSLVREGEREITDWRLKAAEDTRRYERPALPAEPPRQEDQEEEEDDEAWALELLKDDSDLNVKFKKVTPAQPAAKVDPPQPPPVAQPASAPPIRETPPPFVPPVQEEKTVHFESDALASGRSMLWQEDRQKLLREPDAEPTERKTTSLARPSEDDGETVATKDAAKDERLDTSERSEHDSEPAAQSAGAWRELDTKPSIKAAVVPAEAQQPLTPAPASPPPPEAPAKRKPIRPKVEPKSPPLQEVIASLEPEPLELSWQEPGAWRKRLLWPALALFALVCLLAQVAWLEFGRLSRIEPYRSFYAIVCQYAGCELPELIDRSQIQTSNLLVRSHPEVADALQVDVILQNNAPFEQSFPSLELTFTNLRSEPVATRKLSPAEYLGGELAGQETMPVRQPIHIALEIADPGKDAVSYHITIVD